MSLSPAERYAKRRAEAGPPLPQTPEDYEPVVLPFRDGTWLAEARGMGNLAPEAGPPILTVRERLVLSALVCLAGDDFGVDASDRPRIPELQGGDRESLEEKWTDDLDSKFLAFPRRLANPHLVLREVRQDYAASEVGRPVWITTAEQRGPFALPSIEKVTDAYDRNMKFFSIEKEVRDAAIFINIILSRIDYARARAAGEA